MITHRSHTILIALSCLVAFPAVLHAQAQHDFSLGGHAGVSMYLTDGPHLNLPSAALGIDMAYTLRGTINRQTALGIKIGAGLTFANAKHSLPNYEEQYTNFDYYPSKMDYTIVAATYVERQLQLQVEAPLYISFASHGVTINIGGKFMMPFVQQRRLDVKEAHITAYYDDFWVPVTDYLATGRLPDYQHHDKQTTKIMPRFNALLSAEIGYEWNVGWKNKMGILVYADYSIWNNFQNNPRGYRLIDVPPILNTEYPVPDIKVNYLIDTYANKANYLSCGIKVYYAFHNESVKAYPCQCVRD